MKQEEGEPLDAMLDSCDIPSIPVHRDQCYYSAATTDIWIFLLQIFFNFSKETNEGKRVY